MKFCYLLLQIVIFISFLVLGMESRTPKLEENGASGGVTAPEYIPGSNMIGAGRGARINRWKEGKSTANPETATNAPGAEKK